MWYMLRLLTTPGEGGGPEERLFLPMTSDMGVEKHVQPQYLPWKIIEANASLPWHSGWNLLW